MAAVTAVTFALDGTLCTYRHDAATVLTEAFDTAGVDQFCTSEEVRSVRERFRPTTETPAGLLEATLAALAERRGRDPDAGRRVAAAYTDARDHTAVDARPEARETIRGLAEDYRLGLVTNGAPEIQRPKLAALGLADGFETVVCAGYDALAKPDPSPFMLALDRLDVRATAAVHVGSARADLQGGDAAGMRTAWLGDGDPPLRPHFRPGSLGDLRAEPW